MQDTQEQQVSVTEKSVIQVHLPSVRTKHKRHQAVHQQGGGQGPQAPSNKRQRTTHRTSKSISKHHKHQATRVRHTSVIQVQGQKRQAQDKGTEGLHIKQVQDICGQTSTETTHRPFKSIVKLHKHNQRVQGQKSKAQHSRQASARQEDCRHTSVVSAVPHPWHPVLCHLILMHIVHAHKSPTDSCFVFGLRRPVFCRRRKCPFDTRAVPW